MGSESFVLNEQLTLTPWILIDSDPMDSELTLTPIILLRVQFREEAFNVSETAWLVFG